MFSPLDFCCENSCISWLLPSLELTLRMTWEAAVLDLSPQKICLIKQFSTSGASLAAQLVKNPPAMRETWVRLLGWEDPLEEGMETHCSVLAWRIPWTDEPGGLRSTGWQRVRHDWATKPPPYIYIFFFFFFFFPANSTKRGRHFTLPF